MRNPSLSHSRRCGQMKQNKLLACKERKFIWRGHNEVLSPKNVIPKTEHGERSIMLSGCFSEKTVVIKVNSIMIKQNYYEILNVNLKVSLQTLKPKH